MHRYAIIFFYLKTYDYVKVDLGLNITKIYQYFKILSKAVDIKNKLLKFLFLFFSSMFELQLILEEQR